MDIRKRLLSIDFIRIKFCGGTGKEPPPGSPHGLHVRTQENSWIISSPPSPHV